MKSLFIKPDADAILARVGTLTEDSQRQWGSLNVCQMLVHCRKGLKMALGEIRIRRTWIGLLLGRKYISLATNDIPFRQGSPSAKGSIELITEDFDIEKERLIHYIHKFCDGSKEGCTDNPHFFFGKLSPTQWGALMHKHLDHHLKQFGV